MRLITPCGGFALAGTLLVAGYFFDVVILTVCFDVFGQSLSDTLQQYYRHGQLVVGIGFLAGALCQHFCPAIFETLRLRAFTSTVGTFSCFLFLSSLTIALLTQYYLFDNIPHVTDAISHDFQARILHAGHVTAPLPPCHEAFFQHHVIMTETGKWFSKYTPGHPLILTAGYFMGMPFLPVPLCHALLTLFFYRLVRKFYSEQTARTSSLLLISSPLATLLGASYMSHTSFLWVVLAGMLTLYHTYTSCNNRRWRHAFGWGFLAGLSWGWALITRPQDALICGLITVIAFLCTSRPRQYIPFATSAGFAATGLLIPLMIFLLWNKLQYGVYFALGYGFTQEQVLNRVYQASFGLSDQFTFRDAIRLLVNTAYRFDRAALGWPLFLPLCLITFFRHRFDRQDTVCAIAALIHISVYFFYDYYGLEFEARYYFNILPLTLILLVRSFEKLPQHHSKASLNIVLVAMLAHNLFTFWPLIILPTYATDYEQASPALHQSAAAQNLENAVVFIDPSGNEEFRYSSGFLYNSPFLDGDILYARLTDQETMDCLQAAYPDRAFYTAAKSDDPPLKFTFTPVETD